MAKWGGFCEEEMGVLERGFGDGGKMGAIEDAQRF